MINTYTQAENLKLHTYPHYGQGKSMCHDVHDQLLHALIHFAHMSSMRSADIDVLIKGLALREHTRNTSSEQARLFGEQLLEMCGNDTRRSFYAAQVYKGNSDIIALRLLFLQGLQSMAVLAAEASGYGFRRASVDNWFRKGLVSLCESRSIDEWFALMKDLSRAHIACMAMVDSARAHAFGQPKPQQVSLKIESGPFIVVCGHGMQDLNDVLEQSQGLGVHVYTHGEMIMAHSYPALQAYPHLRGHIGASWHDCLEDYAHIPAVVLHTSAVSTRIAIDNPKRLYSSADIGNEGMKPVGTTEGLGKDFTALITHAMVLKGYTEEERHYDAHGCRSHTISTGHQALYEQAEALCAGLHKGSVSHYYVLAGDIEGLVQSQYAHFMQQSSLDSSFLTLGCCKDRFRDMHLETNHAFPRLLSIGACGSVYRVVQLLVALSEVMSCSMKDVPISLVVNWSDESAVAMFLTLAALGMNVVTLPHQGPAFLSEEAGRIMAKHFGLQECSFPANAGVGSALPHKAPDIRTHATFSRV